MKLFFKKPFSIDSRIRLVFWSLKSAVQPGLYGNTERPPRAGRMSHKGRVGGTPRHPRPWSIVDRRMESPTVKRRGTKQMKSPLLPLCSLPPLGMDSSPPEPPQLASPICADPLVKSNILRPKGFCRTRWRSCESQDRSSAGLLTFFERSVRENRLLINLNKTFCTFYV